MRISTNQIQLSMLDNLQHGPARCRNDMRRNSCVDRAVKGRTIRGHRGDETSDYNKRYRMNTAFRAVM